VVQTSELPSLDTTSQIKEWFKRLYDGIVGVRPFTGWSPIMRAAMTGGFTAR